MGKTITIVLIFLSVLLITEQAFAQIHSIDGEYIKEWLVLGPFLSNDIETDFLADVGGEANIHPREGDGFTMPDGSTLAWKKYKAKGNTVDLIDAIGDYENANAYAYCILQSETVGETQVYFGNHYAAKVWMNGKQLHSNIGGSYLCVDEHLFEMQSKAGINQYLVKVSRRTGDWGFTIRTEPL